MPIGMKYCWTENTITYNSKTGLSVYGTPIQHNDTACSVYTWGNVDAFGSMALIWLPNEIINYTIEESISAIPHPELPPQQAMEYKTVQKIVEHKLSGWFPCSNRCLIP